MSEINDDAPSRLVLALRRITADAQRLVVTGAPSERLKARVDLAAALAKKLTAVLAQQELESTVLKTASQIAADLIATARRK